MSYKEVKFIEKF